MKQITEFLKQNWFWISLLAITAVIIFTVVFLLWAKNNSLNSGKRDLCETMCVYNTNKSTWDFSSETINRSFPTKNICLMFCISIK